MATMMGKKRQDAWYNHHTPITRLLAVGITTVGGMVALT
jgi:hypothetical protein